ncbi:hypothetical protein AGDE_04477 [Angomonas deanei]|uniref:EDRF1 N-terminal domain-containing protein n=1 Tax=Angomonas deanei TaxID=59799 RepID=A0A7G2CVY4_9TRYP|nr:hypothetical protein AGDE_04477 [Angomonas deanei]CAD2222593.1 hypothetical protein, conserved [Angomonas deanei]|eukprot:EPY39451.1 hypothetical protein AGDE_04477 [Angomonas deanei]
MEDDETTPTESCSHEQAIVPFSFFNEFDEKDASSPSEDIVKTKPLSTMPVYGEAQMVPANVTGGNIHVRRVDGVPALPMHAPLPAGTNLNIPTGNYLTYDKEHNIHQHAPGFEKDRQVALHSLLRGAVMEWKNTKKDNVMILSTGDAMRAVFEQNYTDDHPLTLQVRRIGPTIVVDTHSSVPSSVRSRREEALLGKTLYRLKAQEEEAAGATEEKAVALPLERISNSVSDRRQEVVSQYSQLLRWDIDQLEVLVGVDTPVILNRNDGTEQMLKLEDTSQPLTQDELQRDTLNCWFDATLANVPQLGIYVHNAGIVQSFEVKKVQELLGLVEGRIATAAMNFTSNVLQWLVTHCTKEDATYAVFRCFQSDYLELYELPSEKVRGEAAEHDDTSETEAADRPTADEEELRRLNVNLAKMCFGMAQHLYREGNEEKAGDALNLLLRSFVVFLQNRELSSSADHVLNSVKMIPFLIGRFIRANANRPSPEMLREALVIVGRFESRLRQSIKCTLTEEACKFYYVHCLLPCSAALCVVVAHTMEAYYEEKKKGTKKSDKTSGQSIIQLKDLLQIVVEGLVRLEHISNIAECYESMDAPLAPKPPEEEPKDEGALVNVCPAKKKLDVGPLHTALSELYGDVVLLTMSDDTPFTSDTLREISKRMLLRDTESKEQYSTTLKWLGEMTYDTVSLSFTALRFYTKAGSCYKRHILKTGQTYYYVGKSYTRTSRYTKALEALYRSRSLFTASANAPDDDVFGECFITCGMVNMAQVQLALGEVFVRMTDIKRRFNQAEVSLSIAQPLCITSEVFRMTPEEEQSIQNALDAFTEGGWSAQRSTVLTHYAGRLIDNILLSGTRCTIPQFHHMYSILAEAKAASEGEERWAREWHLFRLVTVSGGQQCLTKAVRKVVDGALTHWAESVEQERTSVLQGTAGTCVAEVYLQFALVKCVLLEHDTQSGIKQNLFHEKEAMRQAALYVIKAVDTYQEAKGKLKKDVTVQSWKVEYPTGYIASGGTVIIRTSDQGGRSRVGVRSGPTIHQRGVA